MSQFDPRRAAQVRSSTESLSELFREIANRLFFRETVKRQPDIGAGRPGEEAQRRTRLANSDSGRAVTSEVDLVLLGYWWDGGVAYTCSAAERSLLRIVSHSAWVRGAVQKENAWRLKGRQQEFMDLLQAAQRIRQAVAATSQMERLARMISLCTPDLPINRAFPPEHAEGQMVALLMETEQPPKGPVDLYLTRSPCRYCANGFARLSKLHDMYREITRNPPAHQGSRRLEDEDRSGRNYDYSYDQFRKDYEDAGFDRWKIGWILYGAPYVDRENRTDWAALDRAVRNGSISGHRRWC